jgi:tetratricopeptide (TPR) repeat protein
MTRMIDAGEPICGAIRQADVDRFTSRAYIFIGTATASFSMDDTEELTDDPVRLVAVMQNYLRLLSIARTELILHRPEAFTSKLYAEFKSLREGLIARNEDYLKSVIANSMLAEIEVLNYNDDIFNVGLEYRRQLVERCNQFVADAPLEEKQRDRRVARLLFHRAEINRLRGDFAQADADAKASIAIDEKLGLSGDSARQALIQIAIDENQIDDSLDLAQHTKASHEKASGPESDPWYELVTLGRLCQIMKRNLSRLDEGVELAKKGVAIAVSMENLREVAVFELDLAQLSLLKKKPQDALDAAKRALAASRRANNPIGELAAYGTIGQCYMALSDTANARTHALLGLERARQLNEHQRAVAFLADLARIEELDGDIQKSIRYWLDATEAAARLAGIDSWQVNVRAAAQACRLGQDSGSCARLICTAIASLSSIKTELMDTAGRFLFSLLPSIYSSWPPATRRNLLESVLQDAAPTLSNLKGQPRLESYGALLFEVCHVLFLVETGRGPAAAQLAAEIDQLIGAQDGFVEMVKQVTGKGRDR